MSKKEKQNETLQQEPVVEEQDVKQEAAAEPEETAVDPLLSELESLKDQVAGQEDKYLRLAAEYDNYRKRTAKEKESLWTDVKADTAGAFLPVYDNLERALKQDTADEAFKKGVEMTMNQLKEVLTKLGITEIPAQGQPFDPKYHNAVMHVEDESLGRTWWPRCSKPAFSAAKRSSGSPCESGKLKNSFPHPAVRPAGK